MNFEFTERHSVSPFVNQVWCTRSEKSGTFFAPAVSHWEMVVTQQNGDMYLTVVGPQTQCTPAPAPEEATFLGIQFELGAFMPHLSPMQFVNSGEHLPNAGSKKFWLNGSAWEFPTYENVETFVKRLVQENILVFDKTVAKVLQDEPVYMSSRSVQRAFIRATGLSYRKIAQIERAQQAAALLQSGVTIQDTVAAAGYADQAHLTRTLKQMNGVTPAQIKREVQQK